MNYFTMKNRGCLTAALACLLALMLCVSCTPAPAPETGTETDAPSEAVTDAPTEPQTEIPTDPATDAPTEPVTDTPTEPATEPDTEPETEPETEVYTMERTIGERYFIFRIWNFTKLSQRSFEKAVDTVASTGFNAIKVHIPWSWVEQTDGVYDFADFDAMVDYVVNTKHMAVAISLDLTRVTGDKVIPEDEIMRNPEGKLSLGGTAGNRMQISFASEHAVSKAVAFYEEAVRHYDELFGDKVLFYLPAFSQYCETEYWCTDDYDYSDAAVKGFRRYLEEVYGSLEALNEALRTKYTAFREINPPSANDISNFGVLWYQYRHQNLKAAIDRLADAQHTACPGTKFALQLGCVYDSAAKRRCTLGFTELCEKADVLWVDDGPTMNHTFSMDYMWSVLPAHIELAQEIDGPTQVGATPENYRKQGMECFAYGVKYLSIANWGLNDAYYTYEPVWEELVQTWLLGDQPEVMSPLTREGADPEMVWEYEMNLKNVMRAGSPEQFMSKYTSRTRQGYTVFIRITDNLLHANVLH